MQQLRNKSVTIISFILLSLLLKTCTQTLKNEVKLHKTISSSFYQLKINFSCGYALCVLFGLEFTSSNVTNAKSKLESYDDLEICYKTSDRKSSTITKVKY